MTDSPPGTNLGKGMLVFAWVIVLLLLTLFFGQWERNQYNPNTDPLSQIDNHVKEVILKGNQQHHYIVTGRINGQTVIFLLDTGASDVVISQQLANKLGLQRGARGYAQTANGTVDVYATQLESIVLGPIRLYNVKASINPGMNGDEVLLGMSALKQIEFTQRGNELTLRQYIESAN